MGSGSDDVYDIGQTYQDLVKAEQTASELESRLDNLDSQLEAMIRASNIPPELFDADDETLKRILEAASANSARREQRETASTDESSESQPRENIEETGKETNRTSDQTNGTGEGKKT